MTDTTADILRKARDHIAKPGMWWQGGFGPAGYDGDADDEPRCAAGAIYLAARVSVKDGHNVTPSQAVDVIRRLTEAEGFRLIGDWNDAPGRTQAEVVALFDRAIELAEKEGTP